MLYRTSSARARSLRREHSVKPAITETPQQLRKPHNQTASETGASTTPAAQVSSRDCTGSEREQRLRQLSDNQQRRLAAEREERLRQVSDNQQRRLAAKTAQEREQRLRQPSDNQQRRLAAETAQEREKNV